MRCWRADPAKGGDQLSMDRLRDILRQVDLTYLLDRDGVLEDEINWEEVPSLGEKQRLAMARLIFAKPNYAILDGKSAAFHEPLALACCRLANQQAPLPLECTSAVSSDMERRLYAVSTATVCHHAAI